MKSELKLLLDKIPTKVSVKISWAEKIGLFDIRKGMGRFDYEPVNFLILFLTVGQETSTSILETKMFQHCLFAKLTRICALARCLL